VHKIHLLTGTEITFVLTTGGHNAGIVSEPGHRGRSYQVMTRPAEGAYVDADAYLAQAPQKDGSWWPEWQRWLAAHSSARVAPPPIGAPDKGYPPIDAAPGSYVLMT
jgi:polyhydroxyalkanoate synthase